MMHVWGAADRSTGLVVYTTFDKVNEGDHRAGPASCAEVLHLIKEYIKKGSCLLTDGLLAYKGRLERDGYTMVRTVIHTNGEYVNPSDPSAHTQTIDGAWGHLKDKIRARKDLRISLAFCMN